MAEEEEEQDPRLALLQQQKDLIHTAAERRGQTPTKRITRSELKYQYGPQQGIPSDENVYKQTNIGEAYPPCTTPLTELKPITLRELRLETHHRGRVLVVRAFGHPVQFQAVQNAVEDEKRNVERLSVQFADEGLEAEDVLPRDSVFAIKEPYYKMTVDGFPAIMVDHPSDILRLRENDKLVPDALQPSLVELSIDDASSWKKKGNAAVKQKDWRTAIEAYSRGLEECTEGRRRPRIFAFWSVPLLTLTR